MIKMDRKHSASHCLTQYLGENNVVSYFENHSTQWKSQMVLSTYHAQFFLLSSCLRLFQFYSVNCFRKNARESFFFMPKLFYSWNFQPENFPSWQIIQNLVTFQLVNYLPEEMSKILLFLLLWLYVIKLYEYALFHFLQKS